jgi:hypothetical protein
MCTRIGCTCVFPYVVLLPSFHDLSPSHLHHTCTRPCQLPSKGQNMGTRAMTCENCPKAPRPYVHKNRVHVGLSICCSITFSPWSLPQPQLPHMYKTMKNVIKESIDGGKGNDFEFAQKLQGPMSTRIGCMWVFPNVVLLPLFLRLSPNHPHHTCTRSCRIPT